MGKKGLIRNELPRSAGYGGEVTILDLQVRTDFSEKVAFFFGCSRFAREKALFQGFYEPDGRFEPIGGVLLHRSPFLLHVVLCLNNLGLGPLEFRERQRLLQVRPREPVDLLVECCHLLREAREVLRVRGGEEPLFVLQLGDHPVRPGLGNRYGRIHEPAHLAGNRVFADVLL